MSTSTNHCANSQVRIRGFSVLSPQIRQSGIQALGIRIQLKEPEILLKIGIWRNPSSTDKQSGILDIINFTDKLKFPGNCPPTPPLSQHFALSEK